MKDKVMDALQRFSKAMFIPVLILPIAGISSLWATCSPTSGCRQCCRS